MKKLLITIIGMLLITVVSFAQQPDNAKSRVKRQSDQTRSRNQSGNVNDRPDSTAQQQSAGPEVPATSGTPSQNTQGQSDNTKKTQTEAEDIRLDPEEERKIAKETDPESETRDTQYRRRSSDFKGSDQEGTGRKKLEKKDHPTGKKIQKK